MPHQDIYNTCVLNSIKLSAKTCIFYTFLYRLESKTKLRIGSKPSGQKNTVKIFTNLGHFFIIFSMLKKLESECCLLYARTLAMIPAKINLMRHPSHVQIYSSGAQLHTVSLPLRFDYALPTRLRFWGLNEAIFYHHCIIQVLDLPSYRHDDLFANY